MAATQEPAPGPERVPAFRVVRGVPTPEELAALVGAFLVRSRPPAPTGPAAGPGAGSAWARSARPGGISRAGLPTRPDGDAWRLSGLPH